MHSRRAAPQPARNAPQRQAMLAAMPDRPETDHEDRRSLSGGMDMEQAAVVLDGGKDLDRAGPFPES